MTESRTNLPQENTPAGSANELWKIAEIASYWRCSVNTARARLAIVGAPPAIAMPDAKIKLWEAAEVRAWTLRHAEHPGTLAGAAQTSTKRLRGPRKVA